MSSTPSEAVAAWNGAAAAWERRRDAIAALGTPVTERLVEALNPSRGETILELACGNGEVGLALAPLLGNGLLVQSDVAAEMVDASRREGARRGFENVEHRILDAMRLELPDASVDGVVCRWGYMLLDDPVAALAESRRVLRPGGRIALAVWAERAHNPWATVVGQALLEEGLTEPPDPDAPGPFRLGAREALSSAIRDAGLEEDVTDEVAVEWRLASAETFWEITVDLSTSTQAVLADLDDERVAGVRRRVAELLQPFAVDGGVVIPGLSRIAVARRVD